jgi:alpha-galactosidase
VQIHLLRADGVGVSYKASPTDIGARFDWSVSNVTDEPVRVRSVRLVFALHGFAGAPRMFRHGYQSWSESDVATFGVDRDPSFAADHPFFQGAHHADAATVANEYELRSEWVTLIGDANPERLLVGFIGSGNHDGTLRLTHGVEGDTELHAEAFLGDFELAPRSTFVLDPVVLGGSTDELALLEAWADAVKDACGARVDAPYQVGWCSWYHYFDDITEDAFRANLRIARERGYPFDVFQLDDGYQSAIGDWLRTNDKFPSGLPALAQEIAAAGFRPGIWLAPFLAGPDSRVATEHPDWLARFREDRPLKAWFNPIWGGSMYALDTSNPAVLDHLEATAAALREMGFSYLKLDFTFAPSFDGIWHDPTKTAAQRVRAGFDAIRRGAGNDAFLLGCGAPLAHVVGVVDGNRIGPDVAPLWEPTPEAEVIPGYLRTQPSTKFAQDATVLRSFMHRRLWLNDPDCLMLRTEQTALTAEEAAQWAHTVASSGGMALVSDDLALLDERATRQLQETIERGRRCDDATKAGRGPLAPVLFPKP